MRIICTSGGYVAANTYFVIGKNNYTLIIDPTDSVSIQNQIKLDHLTPIAILLTHGHFDHTVALNELTEAYSIPVYIHASDAEMLDDPIKNGLHLFYPDASFVRFNGQLITLRDDDELSFEGFESSIMAIHTPGHTKGSACYLFNDPVGRQTLFSGDVLFEGSIGRTDLYGGSAAEMQASLHELSKLPNDIVVYPGHGPSTDIGSEKRGNPYFM